MAEQEDMDDPHRMSRFQARLHARRKNNDNVLLDTLFPTAVHLVAKAALFPWHRRRLFCQLRGDGSLKFADTQLRSVGKTQGVLSLWTGVSSELLGQIPRIFAPPFASFLSFSALEGIFGVRAVKESKLISELAGLISGALLSGITFPIEVITTRLALETSPSASILNTLVQVVREHGISGFYSGFWVSLLGSVSYRLIWRTLMIPVQKTFSTKPTPGRPSEETMLERLSSFLKVEATSFLVGFLFFPVDTIVRQMMLHPGMGVFQAIDLVRDRGWYSGFEACFVHQLATVGVKLSLVNFSLAFRS